VKEYVEHPSIFRDYYRECLSSDEQSEVDDILAAQRDLNQIEEKLAKITGVQPTTSTPDYLQMYQQSPDIFLNFFRSSNEQQRKKILDTITDPELDIDRRYEDSILLSLKREFPDMIERLGRDMEEL
jgi:hypothetical protein